MTPTQFLARILDPAALAFTGATGIAQTPEARVLLLAIAMQESGLEAREQAGGPAHGFWQFESEGVGGVLGSSAAGVHLRIMGAALAIEGATATIYQAITYNDPLAYACARLLLWTDSAPLPQIGDANGAWDYYQRNWRPGRPRPGAWGVNYPAAVAAVQGA